ncbi:MAG TPA: sigma-70 family RNA polymerase sigma factor [Pusillimonas sp.]|uniref:sigma-70 family RNA polymerase sigma factor n=1 Tax=unclassified Pusillimonas TaxID=2640016 RepID=UPI00260DBAA9|nr:MULTISPECIES: sigma-70 family RNA polymerase sigma factor [unclassified Pusillimonas]HLU18727.1 sigma-70 family RNA polymerase sigma factor [Pusillimonas sp.]
MADPTFDYQAALASCAQGDAQALRRLYAQEAPQMLALANIMLADQTAAQSAVHDAFVLIWKNAASYDPRTGSGRAWMYSIMRYRTLNLLRRQPTRTATTSTPDPLPRHAAEGSGLAATLARQPDQTRKPILMAFFGGMDYAEIARRVGCSRSEIRNRVRACLRLLREHTPA